MKYFSKSLLSMATLIVAGQVFAGQAPQVNCPPVSLIANANFSKVISSFVNVWVLLSDSFKYENNEWNVLYTTMLDDIKTRPEALQKGNVLFKNESLKEGSLK
jgi:hypothetical protein